jgi:ADP-ribose pyrophosphatase YjhB (NUDIX family)
MFPQFIRFDDGLIHETVVEFEELEPAPFHRHLLDYLYLVPEESLLANVSYTNGETQLAMTGTCKFNETPIESAERELAEEVGLLAPLTFVKSFRKGDRQWHIYTADVREAKSVGEVVHESPRRDNRKEKVAVFLYGSLDDFRILWGDVPDTISEDRIEGITLMTPKDVNDLFL